MNILTLTLQRDNRKPKDIRTGRGCRDQVWQTPSRRLQDDYDDNDKNNVSACRVGEKNDARAMQLSVSSRGRRVSYRGSHTVRRRSIRWCGGDSVAETTVVEGSGGVVGEGNDNGCVVWMRSGGDGSGWLGWWVFGVPMDTV